MSEDKRRERLRFRSWHRGTREMDLLLGSFADAHLHAFTLEQLARYEELMQVPDPDLYEWITGKTPVPDDKDNDVVRKLCAHNFVARQV